MATLPGRCRHQLAEQQRADDAAQPGADRVEQRDRHRAGLHREDLADRQVGGAGAGRGQEEHGAPAQRQGGRVQAGQEQRGGDQQQAAADVADRDHDAPADGVEQPPEQHRPEEVPDRQRDDVPAGRARPDVEEGGQHEPLGEEHRVVEERLPDEQRQPQQRALAVVGQQRAGDLAEGRPVALLDLRARRPRRRRASGSSHLVARPGARPPRRSAPPPRRGRG